MYHCFPGIFRLLRLLFLYPQVSGTWAYTSDHSHLCPQMKHMYWCILVIRSTTSLSEKSFLNCPLISFACVCLGAHVPQETRQGQKFWESKSGSSGLVARHLFLLSPLAVCSHFFDPSKYSSVRLAQVLALCVNPSGSCSKIS